MCVKLVIYKDYINVYASRILKFYFPTYLITKYLLYYSPRYSNTVIIVSRTENSIIMIKRTYRLHFCNVFYLASLSRNMQHNRQQNTVKIMIPNDGTLCLSDTKFGVETHTDHVKW
jgi:hypothetical protein